jgi:hypothetical protein
MKNKIFSVLLLLILVFLVANKINVKAYESNAIEFIGQDSSKTKDEKSNAIKITDNNSEYETSITFLVHGLTSKPSVWSNTLGKVYGANVVNPSPAFQYDPNSIIEVLRRRCNADVYLVDECQTVITAYDENDVAISASTNSFKLRKLFVTTDSSGQLVYANNNYVSSITSVNNHVIVIYEASATDDDKIVNVAYEELKFVINMVTYDVTKVKNSKVKINLIGHSRGGLINMKYAINYPYNVDSLFSMGTPYNGTKISPLNGLINKAVDPSDPNLDALELNDLVNCQGGVEISNITELNNTLKNEWKTMNETYHPNINFHPIAGVTGLTYLIGLLDDASSEYSNDTELNKIVITVKYVLIELEKWFVENSEQAYMPQYLEDNSETIYNESLPLFIAIFIYNSGVPLTMEEKDAIT